MWKQMLRLQTCLCRIGLKGHINIWVRCIKQGFSVGVSTLQRGLWFHRRGNHRGCAKTETKSVPTAVAQKWTLPNVPLCGCKWISALNLNTEMKNWRDNLSLFTVAPVRASAPGWKIAGNCWSHWIKFGFGWKTKITNLWLLKRQGQGAWRPYCLDLIWYIFLPLQMSEVLARDGEKRVRGGWDPHSPSKYYPSAILHLTSMRSKGSALHNIVWRLSNSMQELGTHCLELRTWGCLNSV